MPGLTILRVVNNTEIERAEKARMETELQARQDAPVMLGLASYIRTAWDAARNSREPITTIMLKALRQRNGEYEPDKLNAIQRQGGSEVFMMITEVKCRAAESWLRDILLDTGSPPWDLQPTPIPDLSDDQDEAIKLTLAQKVVTLLQSGSVAPTPEQMQELKEIAAQEYRFKLMQQAQNRVDRMRQRIEDQFAQGGWGDAFNEFITDLVTFPCAFLKGPIVRRQRTLSWERAPGGSMMVSTTETLAPEYERVNPFNIYPEPGISRINDGYIFELHKLTRSALADLIGVPGYDDQAIRKILSEGPGASWVTESHEQQLEEEERKYRTELRPTDVYDALEFWGKVSGAMLREWGMSEDEVPDEAREYDACVWVVGNYVIKAMLNYDPLGEKPYAKTSIFKLPGAFWGRGIPETIEDLQNVCNAAARALVNNMGIASGPQVEVNLERIPPNENITQMHPWKIWQVTNDPLGSSAPAVRFNQPNDNANTLMGVYERFSKLADDHSGIPAYIYGDLDVKGAGRTASGLSMLMGSAGKAIRQIVMHIDNDIIKPIVHRQFVYNMRYDPDESIKGDVRIVARGAVNLAVRETVNTRRVEFLQATANEFDMGIIGVPGRAAILREVAKGLQMPTDEIVPSREKLALAARTQQAMPPPSAAPGDQGAPTTLDQAGNPAGGQEAAVVRNQATGNYG